MPGAYVFHCLSEFANSCPLSQCWCLIISSSAAFVSFCLWFFPASESFLMSQLFTSGGQSIGVSASASDLLMKIQDWFPLGLTGLISCCPRDTHLSFPKPQFRSINSLSFSLLYDPTLTSIRSDQISCSVMSDSLRPMNCSTPGLPVHHQLLELTLIHVHWVSDASNHLPKWILSSSGGGIKTNHK